MKKSVGIIGINGQVGQYLLREMQLVKAPYELKTFGRHDEIPPLDIGVLCTADPVSEQLAAQLKDRVKFIIDMSAKFRQVRDVPLVIPEINARTITAHTHLIASPNCTTTGL